MSRVRYYVLAMFAGEVELSKANVDSATVVGEPRSGGLGSALRAASIAAQEAHQKDVRDKLIDLHSRTFSTAAAYDNAVMLAGYVAFFALWGGVYETLTPVCRLFTVALMGLSLMCYLGWQILQMLTRQWFEWNCVGVFKLADEPARFNDAWMKETQKHEVATARLMRFWPYLFVPAVVLGFGGGIMLTYNSLAIVFGWPQFTG